MNTVNIDGFEKRIATAGLEFLARNCERDIDRVWATEQLRQGCGEDTFIDDDWQDDESDLRNYCACCGHNYMTDGAHDDRACDASQE